MENKNEKVLDNVQYNQQVLEKAHRIIEKYSNKSVREKEIKKLSKEAYNAKQMRRLSDTEKSDKTQRKTQANIARKLKKEKQGIEQLIVGAKTKQLVNNNFGKETSKKQEATKRMDRI
ncbi:hypothetical protein BH747_00045 [Enterococcus villorum]|uniref:Uncharacterized protein n=1 Tax=Enterococcus villorum TaxID=112904 RepID=A0A1V8YLQ0_9ENTE|nr:hypothetical protein [Enterococcus villorum]OQO71260.1 hypothetical protein BH747_00045 [Enterococcus villorum]OQO73555.1 hypothetical protein BH744_10105 [Enterococcus villorum]